MDQSKYLPKGEECLPKGKKYGEKKKRKSKFLREFNLTLDGGKHPSKCKWFNLSIFRNFMLALIVLSSITKKGEIVMNMAPFMSF